jgi:hypothetical protein
MFQLVLQALFPKGILTGNIRNVIRVGYQCPNQLGYYQPFQYYKTYDLIKNNDRFKLDFGI